MEGPAGYVLLLHETTRRSAVIEDIQMRGQGAESVPVFEHAARYPLIVFISFENGWISAIADGRLGRRSASGEKRLNLDEVTILNQPLSMHQAIQQLEGYFKARAGNPFEHGGYIAPGTFDAVVRVLARLSEEAEQRLADVDPERSERIERMSAEERQTLAFQKEAVAAALSLSGFDRKELLQWRVPEGPRVTNYLAGVRQRRPYEDRIIRSDLKRVPGHQHIEDLVEIEGAVFERGDTRLSVYLADKNVIEHQTGADLLYFNEKYGAWIMVQYKSLDREHSIPIYRPTPRGDRQIARMTGLLAALKQHPPCRRCEGFRLSENPFYFKLCDRLAFDPSDKGLAPGMYIPLDYWELIIADDRTLGPGGGRGVTYENSGRYMHNTKFISLVSDGWIGTNIPQSDAFGRALRGLLEDPDTAPLVLAIESQVRSGGTV